MIRVSTTALEAYRRLVQYEFAVEEELVAQVKGKPFTPSWQMEAGSAWDRVLSTSCGDWSGGDFIRVGKYTFGNFKAVSEAVHHCGPGVWQVKNQSVIPSSFGPVTLVGVADQMQGSVIQENKAKFSTPDARDYESSLQWRCYLMIFGAACVRYNLFSFREPKRGCFELTDILSFRFWPYQDLERDCIGWLNDFLSWADLKGLLKYLDRESSTPTAA